MAQADQDNIATLLRYMEAKGLAEVAGTVERRDGVPPGWGSERIDAWYAGPSS